MGICYIVGAGELSPLPKIEKDDFVIAADGGFDALSKLGIIPNLLVGDLDSIKNVPSGVEILRYPAEKDETDMQLAFLEGKKLGYREFMIYGGVGGRADHTFANYSLLLYIAKMGCTARLAADTYEALVINNSTFTLPKTSGKYFSVFAFGGEALGVSIKNAKYELENASLTPEFPIGVSNEFCDTPPTVSVNNGSLLIIFEKISQKY